jgi:hypothetical protein
MAAGIATRARRLLACVLGAWTLGGWTADPVPAADEAIAEEQRITAERAAIGGVADAEARSAAIDRVLAARRDLIESHRGHRRRGVWLADQAADLLFETLAEDAADLTALVGLPTAAQRRRIADVATETAELVSRASAEIDQALIDIEADPEYASGAAAGTSLRYERRMLARDERDLRVPILRGLVACLRGLVETGDPDRAERLFREAADLIEPRLRDLEGSVASRAHLYCAVAATRFGEHDRAEAHLAAVDAETGALPLDRFASRVARAALVGASRGAAAGLRELDLADATSAGPDLLLRRLLAADQRFLLLRAHAAGARSADRDRLQREAYRVYLDFIDRADDASRDAVRRLVLEKLAASAPDGPAIESLPPIVAVARAEALAASSETRDESISAFESALARRDLAEGERGMALFGLARALHAGGRSRDAADRFLQLARDLPRDPAAVAAGELAASIGLVLMDADPADAHARTVVRDAASILVARADEVADLDRWRYAAGKALLAASDHDAAVASFESIAPGAPLHADALFMVAAARRNAAALASDRAAASRRHQAALDAAVRADAAAAQAQDSADGARLRDLAYYRGFLAVFCADALLALGRPQEAIDALEPLRALPDPDPGAIAGALTARIAAYRALGRGEEAGRELEEYVRRAPDQAVRVLASILASIRRDHEAMVAEGRDGDAQRRADEQLAPFGDVLDELLDGDSAVDPAARSMLLRETAETHLLAGRFDAARRRFDELLRAEPSAAALLFGRAECLFHLARTSGDNAAPETLERYAVAMEIYQRIAAAGEEIGHREFWQSQLRLLEILDLVQRHPEQIAARLRRLRLLDPHLGGERYRKGFTRLELKYGGS